jgi:eukaryotic translation initiation factor 2-alpha kinase 4
MDSTLTEQQQQEITALKSIYADDFIECQPRAWKVRSAYTALVSLRTD